MVNLAPAQWSEWGYLRRAGFEKDNQPVYVLESCDRRPLMYAVDGPGSRTMLHTLVGRMCCLYGPIVYRANDIPRIRYMVASSFDSR